MMMMIMNAVQMCQLVKRLLNFFLLQTSSMLYSSKVTGVFYTTRLCKPELNLLKSGEEKLVQLSN